MELFAKVDMELSLFKICKERRFDFFCVYLRLKVKSGPSGDRYSEEKWTHWPL